MEAIGAALASLALSDSVIYAQTAREYGVDPTTLQRRHCWCSKPNGTATALGVGSFL
jgi:hypothetical protein